MAWSAGAVVTATQLNTYAPQAWTSYVPVLTALTTNPTLGNSTLTGKYVQHGKLLHVRINLTIGSTFSAGSGAYFFSLPATCVLDVEAGLGAAVSNGGAGRRGYVVAHLTTTTVALMRTSDHVNLDDTGPGSAWATGNVVGITATCEVV